MSDEETEDLMQELSDTVTKHVRMTRKEKLEGQNIPPTLLQQQLHLQQNAAAMMPIEGSNPIQPHNSSDMNPNLMPPMPQL